MGSEGYCTCSKDIGEKSFTLKPLPKDNNRTNIKKDKNDEISVYDNYYKNINLINSNYFSINPTNHNNENHKKWQNCVLQKNAAETFYGHPSEKNTINNSINYTNTNNINNNIDSNTLNIPMGDRYEGEIKNNKPNGQGMYFAITGEIKEGNFKDGLLNGKGKMTLSNGFFLEGNFKDDQLEGQGKTVNINGEIYEGEFKEGIREGWGKLILSNEERFEGNFSKGKINGFGKYSNDNGESYEGEFLDGIPNGKGKKKYIDGCQYEGNFLNGKENGAGIKKEKNGQLYEGEFVNGMKQGKGKHILKNGKMYEGDFYEDKYNGKGTLTWPDGTKYIGEFKNGKMEGKGVLTCKNNHEGEMESKNNKNELSESKILSEGEKFEGEFLGGNQHGKGILYQKDGYKLEGNWENGKKVGTFNKISPDGKKQEIEYKNDIFQDGGSEEKSGNGIIKIEINEEENIKKDEKNGKIKKLSEISKNEDNQFNEDTFNEFTFVLLTNFEAKKLNVETAKEKIIIPFEDTTKYSKDDFINKIKNNISKYLNCNNKDSINNIKNWLLYLLNINNNEPNVLQNEFLSIISNIKDYPAEQEIFLSKKVKKYLLPKKDILIEKFNSINKKYITFITLKKIIEDIKIELKEQYFVFLFYALKKFDDPEASLNDLKYELLVDILEDSNNDSKMDEESDLEVSDDDYNKIITEFQIKLLTYINSNHTNLRFILNGLIQVVNWGDDNNVIEVVLIRPFFERMKEIGIWINNELEIYCIFNRYKLSEKNEGINIYLLEEELKNLKISNYKNNKFKSTNLEDQVIKEENEENSFDNDN